MGPDGSVELYDALTCITHARLLLMSMFPNYGNACFEIAFLHPAVDGSYNEHKARGDIVPRNRWIDNLTSRSAYDAFRPNGKEFLNGLYSEQKSEPRQEEPDYDLPTESTPPSPPPSRSDAPHEDEGAAQAKSRMRRPAPQAIEEERKIKPFAKTPITFMFHATYGENLINIMEHGLKSGRSQSNPSGRVHVHMARIDDVILDDEASEAALTHVPTGRDDVVDPGTPQGPGLRHPTLRRANSIDRANHRGEEHCYSI